MSGLNLGVNTRNTNHLDNIMGSGKDVRDCKSLDDSWCVEEKQWCCYIHNCNTKNTVKKAEIEPVVKATRKRDGEKHIYYNNARKKYHLQLVIDGKKKSIGWSADINELVKLRDKYLNGGI